MAKRIKPYPETIYMIFDIDNDDYVRRGSSGYRIYTKISTAKEQVKDFGNRGYSGHKAIEVSKNLRVDSFKFIKDQEGV